MTAGRRTRTLAARTLLLVLAAAVTTGATGVTGTAAAQEAATGEAAIAHAQPVDGAVELLVSVPAGAEVDLSAVGVSIGGTDVTSEASLAATRTRVERTSVLAIDTSLSMRGERIAAAERAAQAYLEAVPDDVEVGVVTFDDDVTTVLDPTTDRPAARDAVRGLELQRETALYDGVLGAIEATGSSDAGQRSVLLLSDGEDSTGTSLSATLREVGASGVLLDVVALQQRGPGAMPLRLLAEQGRGSVLDAGRPAALEEAFREEAEALARQVAVTATVPDDAEESADVVVRLPSTRGELEATAYVPIRAGVDPAVAAAARAEAEADDARATREAATAEVAAPTAAWPMSQLLALGAVGAVGLGVIGVLLTFALSRPATDREGELRTQMQAYGVFGATSSEAVKDDESSVGDQVRDAAEKALQLSSGLEAKIAERLEGAGVKLKAAEWLLLHGGIAFGVAILGLLLGGGSLPLMVVGLLLGIVGPWVYLGIKRGRRLSAFAQALPDTLQLMAGSLSAGLSLAQSVDTIVREGGEPIAGEFRRVVVEGRLGVPFEDALSGVGERMHSKDFEWVVMAIKIQREVGGNLAELLLQVAATLREREYLRRHVKALSAEGRLSAWVLGGLPPGFLAYLAVSRPDYVAVLFAEPIGWAMLAGAAILMASGVLWMMKAAKVEL